MLFRLAVLQSTRQHWRIWIKQKGALYATIDFISTCVAIFQPMMDTRGKVLSSDDDKYLYLPPYTASVWSWCPVVIFTCQVVWKKKEEKRRTVHLSAGIYIYTTSRFSPSTPLRSLGPLLPVILIFMLGACLCLWLLPLQRFQRLSRSWAFESFQYWQRIVYSLIERFTVKRFLRFFF